MTGFQIKKKHILVNMSESRGQRDTIGALHHQNYAAQLCLGLRENRDTEWKIPGSFVNISRALFLAAWLKQPRQQGDEGESEGAAAGLREQPTLHKRLLVFSDSFDSRQRFSADTVSKIHIFLTLSTTSGILLIKD